MNTERLKMNTKAFPALARLANSKLGLNFLVILLVNGDLKIIYPQ